MRIKYYLIATRKRQRHIGDDTEIIELEADNLEQARAEADQRLRGEREKWKATGNAYASGVQISYNLNSGKQSLLHPVYLPFEIAQIVQVVDERPALEFYEEIKTWAKSEKTRITAQFNADPEYREFMRLTKKFEVK